MWRRAVLVLAALGVLAVAALAALGPLMSPGIKERIVEEVGERFAGTVEIERLAVSLVPWPRVTGEGLVLRHRGWSDGPPLIEVDRFAASMGWVGLFRQPRQIRSVTIEGLDIHVPPRRAREEMSREETPSGPDRREDGGPSVVIDRLVSTAARLVFVPSEREKPFRVYEIHDLEMRSVAPDRAMPFRATLTIPRPPGDIQVAGTFGPWAAADPADTPLAAEYVFENADLGVFNGIEGILSSRGAFAGVLGRINVKGETTVPDFAVAVAGNPVHLVTRFDAIVDGMSGDTLLQPVHATLLESAITATGGVLQTADKQGREVVLEADIAGARIEDLLRLAVKGERPIMTGTARITTTLRVPPGERDVADKLELDGSFHIDSARFTDVDVQKSIATLSERGRGMVDVEGGESVVSDFGGRFLMRNGRIHFSELSFTVPGASIRLAGDYALRAEELDFRGTLRMDAALSETTTGFRSLLLRLFDPFFRDESGEGAELPIKVEGTRREPKFGLDIAFLP